MVTATLGPSWSALLVAILWVALWGAPAPAPSSSDIELSWYAEAACPSADRGRARVESFLGTPLHEVHASALSIEVTITGDDGWFVARIDTRTAEGRRRRALPRHRDCALVGEAAALVVAMAIDPAVVTQLGDDQMQALQLGRAGQDTVEPDPAPEPSPEEAPTPEPDPPPNPPRDPAPDRTPQPPSGAVPVVPRPARPFATIRAAGEAGFGHVPTVDLGAGLGVGLGYRRLRSELVGHVIAPRRIAIDEGGATRFMGWAIGARVGLAAVDRVRVELPVLVGAEIGQVRARGVDLADARTARPLLAHVRAGTGVRVRVHPLVALAFDLELLVALVRPSFSVEGHGGVYRPPAVGVRTGLGVELRFPGRPRDGSGSP